VNGTVHDAPSRDFSLRIRTRQQHYSRMGAPTSILVGGGMIAATFGLIRWHLSQVYKKRFPQPEDGHERAERREQEWYWNKDRN
jgi:hypothetical protein